MKPIPLKIRNTLADDPFMTECCVNDGECEGRIEWHHPWEYGPMYDYIKKKWNKGGQINELWSIVPACQYHHRKANNPLIKAIFETESLRRASDDDLQKYPKKDWKQIISYYQKIKML